MSSNFLNLNSSFISSRNEIIEKNKLNENKDRIKLQE